VCTGLYAVRGLLYHVSCDTSICFLGKKNMHVLRMAAADRD